MRTETQTKATPDRLLSIKQICEIVGCAPRTAYRLIDSGVLPRPLKVSGMLRWRESDISAWVASGCEPVRR